MPGIEDRKLEIEHMQRYMSVRPLVKGLDVLDLACGEGYGSAFLAETAASVLGVDIDRDTVEQAAVKYKRDNLRYRQGDAARIPLEDRSVDAVVSFETIEDIDETLQHQFLKEINRVLKEDGILIMSTPNKAVYSDRYDYFNEFHIHEFYLDEFLDFLRAYFPFVKLYQQSFQVVSLLSGCGDTPEAARWYGNAVGTEDAKYYIAVAARKAGRLPDVASVYVQGTGEYEEKTQRIVDLQNEETLRNLHIGNLDRELETRGARIRELQDEEAKRDAHIQNLDGEIEEKNGYIRILRDEKVQLEGEKAQLEGEKRDLETMCDRIAEERDLYEIQRNTLVGERDDLKGYLADSKAECEELKKSVEEKNVELNNKQGHINLLLESDRELQNIKRSLSYRMYSKWWKLRDTMAPPNTRRRLVLKLGVKFLRHPI
jgi:SAM-dependent methyltransferase/predicted nuclease with TOPRIM domain